MDVSVAKTGTDEGLFDKIDESVTKNVADLYPNARFEGVAGVGVTFDNLVLIYNTDAIKTAPDSWNALKDSALKGKVAMLSAPDIVGIGTTIIMDHMNGGTDFIKNIDAGINAMAEAVRMCRPGSRSRKSIRTLSTARFRWAWAGTPAAR